jgi:uncharacterized protein DUF4124
MIRLGTLIVAGALALALSPAQAQVFKCKGPNGVVYQDGPCEGASVVDTRSASGVGGAPSGRQSSSASTSGASGAISTKPTHPVVPEKMRR